MTKIRKIVVFSLLLILLGAFGLFWKGLFDEKRQPMIADPSLHLSQEIPNDFVLFTMPKTGTHLLRPVLEYLTDQNSVSYWSKEVKCSKGYLYNKKMMNSLLLLPGVIQPYWLHQPIHKNCFISILNDLQNQGDFLVTHAPYSVEMENILKERNSLVFFLIRDPRDWVISVIRHPPISGVDIFGEPIGDHHFVSLSLDQKIDYILNGTSLYYSALETLNKFLPWTKSSICCPLRFEALLGPRGGSFTEKEQLVEFRKIANALHLDISDELLLTAFEESFGTGNIFSKGKASTWKEYFKEEHKTKFKELLGDVLIELGYEKDYNW